MSDDNVLADSAPADSAPADSAPAGTVPTGTATDMPETRSNSPGAGLIFFFAVIAALAGLIGLYIHLHKKYPATGKPLSVELLQAAVDARRAVEEGDSEALEGVVRTTRQRLEPALEGQEHFEEADALAEALKTLDRLAPDLGAERPAAAPAEEAGGDAETEADTGAAAAEGETGGEPAAGSREQAVAAVHAWAALIVDTASKSDPVDPIVTSGGYFWADSPNRYLEILFWATFGVLVHLLVRAGVYLKDGKFWATGIYQHVALLFSVPLLTFVFVTLLSLVRLEIAFWGEQGTQLDLRDARILIAISFLVASRPWGLWDYLKSAAGRLFGEKPEGG